MSKESPTPRSADIPTPAPGARTWVRLAPQLSELNPPGPVAGSAFVYHYPFDVFIAADLPDLYEITGGGRTFRVYRPFSATGVPPKWTDEIPSCRIPYRPGTKPPTQEPESVRNLRINHKLGTPTDSLRIDFYPSVDDRSADAFVQQLLGIIRWWTNQWWITRDRRHCYSALHNHFTITASGERVSGIDTIASMYGLLGIEKPLDAATWLRCLELLVSGQSIPLGLQMFLDAVYFHSVGELRRSILEMAIANEVLLSQSYQLLVGQRRLSKSDMKRFLRGNDYLTHLANFCQAVGRSFEAEHPREYLWVRSAWIARGEIAHGETGIAPTPSGTRELTQTDMVDVFRATGVLTEWLRTIHRPAT